MTCLDEFTKASCAWNDKRQGELEGLDEDVPEVRCQIIEAQYNQQISMNVHACSIDTYKRAKGIGVHQNHIRVH